MPFFVKPRLLRMTVLSFSYLPFTAYGVSPAPESGSATAPREIRSVVNYVEAGELAGAVTLVARNGKVISFEAMGYSDLAAQRTMQKDDLFWVASMTKPITAAAVLMLVDDGRLSIDDSVETYLPEFKNPWLIAESTAERQVLRHPARPVTIRDLLTHTHGLTEIRTPRASTPLAQWVDEVARSPLQFEPGSQWRYGNAGMNTLGRIVEVVSGQSFDYFLQNRIFTPLGMTETTFFPTATQLTRLAKSYRKPADGGPLQEVPISLINGELSSTRRTLFPGGGLFSTAGDMLRFYQMLLDGGVAGERRLLSTTSIASMTRSNTGDLAAGFSPGMSWGLGVGIVTTPTGWTDVLPVGSYGHDGAYGTSVMIEPEQRLVMILLIQRAKLNPYTDGLKFRHAFHRAVLTAPANH